MDAPGEQDLVRGRAIASQQIAVALLRTVLHGYYRSVIDSDCSEDTKILFILYLHVREGRLWRS